LGIILSKKIFEHTSIKSIKETYFENNRGNGKINISYQFREIGGIVVTNLIKIYNLKL